MDLAWVVFIFVLGACVGSFLNVVVWRLPRGESLSFPGSHCPQCGKGIRWYDNIPMLSYLMLRGRCRACRGRISPRYPLIELLTAVLVTGLYVAYFHLHLRTGVGAWDRAWPIYISHAALLCGLLVCSIVDIESFIVPLEVCWFVTLLSLVAAAYRPHPWLPAPAAATGAACFGAAAGLAVSLGLQKLHILQPSFLDAEDKPTPPAPSGGRKEPSAGEPRSVALSAAHGVNPRVEMLRELLFLAPALLGAGLAYLLSARVDAVTEAWGRLHTTWSLGAHLGSLEAAMLGYFVGGLWIWGVRILGTFAFGREAMGLGDVHILAAVGAATGWAAPSLAFFVAPFFGLLWALYLFASRNQRELPYGPWLAIASIFVMLTYDVFAVLLQTRCGLMLPGAN